MQALLLVLLLFHSALHALGGVCCEATRDCGKL
jgi:hypothetical protein